MKWNRFHDEPERLRALADLLLGAAYADASFSELEQIEVGARLIKAMGETHLSPSLEAQMATFEPAKLDLRATLTRLNIEDMHERCMLLADVAAIILADGQVEAHERAYLWRLAAMLEIPVDEVVTRIGPEWPARSRPSARPRPDATARRHPP